MAGTRTLAWFSALVLLGLVLLAFSAVPPAAIVEERVGMLVEAPARAVSDAVRPVAQVVLRAGQLRQLTAENAALRSQLARLESELAIVRERQHSDRSAQALLAAVGPAAGDYLSASVVLREPAPGRQSVIIDRGRRDGLAVGQPVLGAGATLAGIVVEVGEHRARVRLLLDRDSAVAAVVQSSRTPGALVGTGDALRLDFVEQGATLVPGDIIVTSALGGQLPGGLLVGRVGDSHSRPQDLFETVHVEPLTDFLRLEHVVVMTGWVPGAGLDTGEEIR